MKQIELTQGKFAIVDDEDFGWLNQHKWQALNFRNIPRAVRTTRKGGRKTFLMHREIMNPIKGLQVDHINRNPLDNRKANLRLCTNQQNHFNKQARKDNKLGIKGVHWHKTARKFRAVIYADGKRRCLGLYNVMGDADSAYRKAEEKYFGEFARKDGVLQ